jgi:hypothetical protein
MTNEGMDLLGKVWNLLHNADTSLSLLESEHLAASEEDISAEVYSIRQEIIGLHEKVYECLSAYTKEYTKPTQSDSRFL